MMSIPKRGLYTVIRILMSCVLKNRYGIRDTDKLKQVEQDIVGAKQQYLLLNPVQGRYTASHLCNIHRFLFEDVYPFAGRYRLETIRKGDTIFLNERDIPAKLQGLLFKLKQEKYLSDLSHNIFIERLAYYIAELNYIHPFREGNGRATREFFRLLIERNGYSVNWTAAGAAALMDAMIASVYDICDLQSVLEMCIK